MRNKLKITASILIAAFLLVGSAVCISISVSNDAGGFTQEINVDKDDSLSGHSVVSRDFLSNEVALSRGSLKDRHWIVDDYGDRAEVGIDIKNANWMTYSYKLDKGPDYASAEQTINATDAKSIKAYARAESQSKDAAESSIIISDWSKKASLLGYSNYAYAGSRAGMVASVAGQNFDSAAGDSISIKERSRQYDGDTALARMLVVDGSVDS